VLDVLFIAGLAGGAIALLLQVPFGIQLWRAVRRIPDLPVSIRLNAFNILACRDLWTPEVEAINKRMVAAGLTWLGFLLLVVATGLVRWSVQQR
jgi:hypothetical protein